MKSQEKKEARENTLYEGENVFKIFPETAKSLVHSEAGTRPVWLGLVGMGKRGRLETLGSQL